MRDSGKGILKTGLLVLALVAALAPVYWILTISLKTEVDQFAIPPKWFSFTPTLQHYTDAFVTRSFGQYLLTSAIVAVDRKSTRLNSSHSQISYAVFCLKKKKKKKNIKLIQ